MRDKKNRHKIKNKTKRVQENTPRPIYNVSSVFKANLPLPPKLRDKQDRLKKINKAFKNKNKNRVMPPEPVIIHSDNKLYNISAPPKQHKNKKIQLIPHRKKIKEEPPKWAIVIPHADRWPNLYTCLDHLLYLTPQADEIIISDWSKEYDTNKIQEYSNKMPITFAHHAPTREFDRSVAINTGRKFISYSNLMLILDADIIIQPNTIGKLSEVFFMGRGLRSLLVGCKGYKRNKSGNKDIPNIATFSQVYGAFGAFKLSDFDTVGGYNPLMVGWGYRDNDFRMRMLSLGCKEIILPIKYIHLWHPDSTNIKTDTINREISVKSKFNGRRWVRI